MTEAVKADTFLSYRGYRWLWINVCVVLGLVVWYALHEPLGVPNGGTLYGYTVGGIATAGILYLMWFGVRKRSYHSHRSTLKGALAAHVWLGVALVVVVPLHSGFQFGVNVHTLAYALMLLVVLSGIWGAVNYTTLAAQVQSHRGGGTVKDLVEQIHITEQNINSLVAQKSDRLMAVRNFLAGYFGDVEFKARFWRMLFRRALSPFDAQKLGALMANLSEAEAPDGITLVKLAEKKRELVNRLQREVKTIAKLKVWLYFHVPLSFGLLIALAIHIFVVFFYRG